ncbi:unnamed protein product [Spodoptera littoralis]|uniref:Uncharacterized protein n=1 Tax=Spodoptera littoralis TaxID=7109 RepID=A0A9P0I6E1_SPOLI|nr:unnamed protein product [Spodoptera littoralis]CAH1640851.1 unnamed protein product [Spodoptera littoralis]
MAAKISYFIIFGIITVVNAKLAADDPKAYVTSEFGLQKILQLLTNQGKYDIAQSHHDDGPKNHHEDTARLSNDGKHRGNYNKKGNQYATQYYDSVEEETYNRRPYNNLEVLNNDFQNNGDKLQHKSDANDVLDRLLLVSLDSNNLKVYKARENEKNNKDIVAFLNDLEKNIADDGNFVSELRCAGNRCGRDRNNQNDDYKDDNRDNLELLREVDGLNLDSNLLKKKIKLSDDLDAVVLGMSDVERLLSKRNSPNLRQQSNLKRPALLKNVDLENLLNGQGDIKKSNVEALVFDLTRVDNGDVLATQIKELISDNNKGQDDEFDGYVNIKRQLNDRGNDAKKGKYQILAHNEDNNNVYVPKWLLNEISKPNVKPYNILQLLNFYLPTSKQQVKRRGDRLAEETEERNRNVHYRRNFDQEVGVPFHLEVQGLGQVSPNAP